MQLSKAGYLRPRLSGEDADDEQQAARFLTLCPGVQVLSPELETESARWHPVFGRYEGVWEAWSLDEQERFLGSSGGVLTTLSQWVTARTPGTVAVGASGSDPSTGHATRTVPVRIMTREEALRSAGSRYAPVAVLSALAESRDDVSAVTVKPCEASALRAFYELDSASAPVIFSFFCAGTPSQRTTDHLIESLGLDVAQVKQVRYRGAGWPGEFSATDGETSVHESYEVSWMQHFGRSLQSRCKICVDGTGEHADIAVGDYWNADERGIPLFDDEEGRSVLIARTKRGAELVGEAIRAGVIHASPMDLDLVTTVQPHQRVRRRTLLGRLVGRVVRGGSVPKYRGYRLVRGVFRDPLRTIKALLGSITRGAPNETWESTPLEAER